MDPGALLKGRSRETAIRRDARGRWFNGAAPITHPKLVESLSGWIERTDDGRFCLKNDINWAYFTLEGSPYFVRRVVADQPIPSLRLSGGHREILRVEILRMDERGQLHCEVRGDLDALFSSLAQFDLGVYLVSDEPVAFEFGGKRVVVSYEGSR